MNEEVHWLEPDEQAAWAGLQRMHAHLTARLNRELAADSGLSAQDYAVLVVLTESPAGATRAHELGRELGWEKSRLSHHLARMEARGMVSRQACPSDQRGLVVAVTAEGRRTIERAAPAHVASVRRWFIDHLDRDQLKMLADLTRTVDDHLAGACATSEPCDGAAAEACDGAAAQACEGAGDEADGSGCA
jgi:DNA-binding MarR family transcriptional regulator